MTTREQLHRAVDDLPETELNGALAFVASRVADAPSAEKQAVLGLTDEQAARFLEGLDDPAAFEAGLRRLVAHAR